MAKLVAQLTKLYQFVTFLNVIIALSYHSQRCCKRQRRRQGWEKLLGPKAAVEAEGKFISFPNFGGCAVLT